MKLYIVRHGETNHNQKSIIQGHYDVPLNRSGQAQAKALGERLKIVIFDIAYSSDLKRASATTEAIMAHQTCPVRKIKALRERNFGIFSNCRREDFYKWQEDACKTFLDKMPRGESYDVFRKRVMRFFHKLYERHNDQTVLISTHGGVKTVLLNFLKKSNIEQNRHRPHFANAGISIVCFHKVNKYDIVLENDTKHLNLE